MESSLSYFKTQLKEKNYQYCIFTLHEEIKNKLISEVQKLDNSYKYQSLAQLKNKCILLLDDNKIAIAIELYALSLTEEPEMYELNRLFEMYDMLTNND